MFAGCFPLPLPAGSGGDSEAADPKLMADFKTGGEDSLGCRVVLVCSLV